MVKKINYFLKVFSSVNHYILEKLLVNYLSNAKLI